MSRHSHTTNFIRDAVVNELVDHGHAALTMESIARRSFSSIGSVYARYPNRTAAMRDVLDACIIPGLPTEMPGPADGPGNTVLGWALRSEPVRRDLTALVEIALCSRHEPDLAPAADHLRAIVGSRICVESDDPGVATGLRWLTGAVLVGHTVLSGIGCSIPETDAPLDLLVRTAATGTTADNRRAVQRESVTAPRPASPVPQRTDEITTALTIAATEELAVQGASRARLRTIAGRVGATTGALYRRFGSKNELVREALVRELGPQRYEWTERLVDAVAGENHSSSPGDVLADQMFSLLGDRTKLLSTLEMIHAARNDDGTRRTLVTQMESAALARADFFRSATDDAALVSPELMGWVIQMAPAGARVLVALGDSPDENATRTALRHVMNTALMRVA